MWATASIQTQKKKVTEFSARTKCLFLKVWFTSNVLIFLLRKQGKFLRQLFDCTKCWPQIACMTLRRPPARAATCHTYPIDVSSRICPSNCAFFPSKRLFLWFEKRKKAWQLQQNNEISRTMCRREKLLQTLLFWPAWLKINDTNKL